MPLDKSCKIILKDCMNLKSSESCLIITDSKLKNIGFELFKYSILTTRKAKLITIPIPESHGSEPPKDVAKEMLSYDIILLATTKSLSHTRARKNASKRGARIASMPGITIDMMKRTLNVDFNKIKSTNKNLIKKLTNTQKNQRFIENAMHFRSARKSKDFRHSVPRNFNRISRENKIKITTKLGTNIDFNLKGRKWISDDGIYTKKGAFGNLPAGEIFIAPLEGKTSGTIIADASVGGLGKVDENVKLVVKNGFIESISGGKVANKFKKLLKNKFYRNVAELGIGTNYKAKITGEVLEDEKVKGTCHIAFGNNRHFGGKVDVPFHVDFVIKKPTIYADNVLIMKNGEFIH